MGQKIVRLQLIVFTGRGRGQLAKDQRGVTGTQTKINDYLLHRNGNQENQIWKPYYLWNDKGDAFG